VLDQGQISISCCFDKPRLFLFRWTTTMLTRFTGFLQWQHRLYSSKTASLGAVPVLAEHSLTLFREQAFAPASPALLPRGSFSHVPAIQKWFQPSAELPACSALNTVYLKKWASTIVPLEITNDAGQFAQVHQPLQFFLECVPLLHQSDQARQTN
jgi:hypothetical protein